MSYSLTRSAFGIDDQSQYGKAKIPAPVVNAPLPTTWSFEDIALLTLLGCATYVFTSAVLTSLGGTRKRDDGDDYGIRAYPMPASGRAGRAEAVDRGLDDWMRRDIEAGRRARDARRLDERARREERELADRRQAAAQAKKARGDEMQAAWDRHINGLDYGPTISSGIYYGGDEGPTRRTNLMSVPTTRRTGPWDDDAESVPFHDVVGEASTRRAGRWDEPKTERRAPDFAADWDDHLPPTDTSTQRSPASSGRHRSSPTLISPRW